MFALHLQYLTERLLRKSPLYPTSPPHSNSVLGVYDFESAIVPTDLEGSEEYASAAQAHFDNLEADALVVAEMTSLHGVERGLAVLGVDTFGIQVVSVADMQEWHEFLQRWAMVAVFLSANVWGVNRVLLFTAWVLMVFLGQAPPTKDEVLGFYTRVHNYKDVVVAGKWSWSWSWGSEDTTHVEVPEGGLFGDSDKVEEVNDLLNIVVAD
tara:strand:- start:3995 stop:4624 length:630 start_codon:yes stop_codon:yes gene_type:complete